MNELINLIENRGKEMKLKTKVKSYDNHENQGFQLSYTQIPCSVEAESMLVFT